MWKLVEDFSDHIGDQLKKAREDAGLSLEDVHFGTRIPKAVLAALEAGDFSVFSSPAYAKSFLAQYSGFLEVDAGMWLDALVPASFISGEFVQPQWMQPEEWKDRREDVSEVPGNPGGWLSALSVLAVSGALVFAAMQGYQLLDSRLGDESVAAERVKENKPVEQPGMRVVNPADQASLLDSSLATEPPHHLNAIEISEQPPRARIVR